jgi:hypothetical protein
MRSGRGSLGRGLGDLFSSVWFVGLSRWFLAVRSMHCIAFCTVVIHLVGASILFSIHPVSFYSSHYSFDSRLSWFLFSLFISLLLCYSSCILDSCLFSSSLFPLSHLYLHDLRCMAWLEPVISDGWTNECMHRRGVL